MDVAEWATGYTRWLVHLGYTPQSAHPWSLDDLQTVLEHLDARISSATGVPLLRLHRDAFTMTILWETCSRGATAVSWCLDDLWLASGVSPAPLSPTGCTPSPLLPCSPPPLWPLAMLPTAYTLLLLLDQPLLPCLLPARLCSLVACCCRGACRPLPVPYPAGSSGRHCLV
jgi:hypothetical protein